MSSYHQLRKELEDADQEIDTLLKKPLTSRTRDTIDRIRKLIERAIASAHRWRRNEFNRRD